MKELTNSTQQSLSQEANLSSASEEIPLILWNPKVHYLTHKSPLRVSIMSQCSPCHHPTFWRSVLMLPSHLRLGLSSGIVPAGLPTKNLYTPHLSPNTCYMPRPSHSYWVDHPNNIWWGVKSVKLHSPVIPLLLCPNNTFHIWID